MSRPVISGAAGHGAAGVGLTAGDRSQTHPADAHPAEADSGEALSAQAVTPAPAVTPAGTPARTQQTGSAISRRRQVIRAAMVCAIWALPLLRPAGPGNTGPVDLALGAALIITALWMSGRRHSVHVPYAVPAGLSVLAGALAASTAYAGAYNSVGGGLLTLIQDLFVLAWAAAIANSGRDPSLLRSITRAWSVSATFWAAILIIGVLAHIPALSGVTARDGARASLTLGDPNLAASYFGCSLLVLRAAQYPRRRLLRWACCALILLAMAFTGSNGGAVAILVATLLGCAFGLAKRRGAVAAILLLSAVALITIAAIPGLHVQTIVAKAQAGVPILRDSIGREAESSGSRSTILAQTGKLYLKDDNLFGLGPGGIKPALQAHQFAYVKEAHDDYAAALVERGLLGGAALVLLLTMVGVRCRRIGARPLRPSYAEVLPRPELLGAAVIAMCVSALFYEVLHFRHVWALFGVVAAFDLWGRRDRDGERPDLPERRRPTVLLRPAFLGAALHKPAPPQPVAPEPVTQEPAPPEPFSPDRVSPEPAPEEEEPVAPEPVAAEPVTQEPVRPESVAGKPLVAPPHLLAPDAARSAWAARMAGSAGARRLVVSEPAETLTGSARTSQGTGPPGHMALSAVAGSGRRGLRFGSLPKVLTANVAARLVALVALGLATILVAREGGPKLLGELTLLRVLPGLVGVLVCCGLPTAVPYFLAGRDRSAAPRTLSTLTALTVVGSLAASAVWLMFSPVLHRLFFRPWGMGVVIAAAVPVCTQLWVAAGKSFLQGENDMRGANWAIAAEEAVFLPVYLALMPFMHRTALLLTALVLSDVLVVAGIVIRLASRGCLRHWGRPDPRLAGEVCRYGLRGQVGGVLTLINLRLDVAILGALTGPGVLGVYAVASKYAELLRLPGLAITYVLYPRLAARDRVEAGQRVAALLPRAVAFTVLTAVPLVAAVPLLPMVYGHAFSAAQIPAYILLVGLVGEGVAGLCSAYLYGVGRPGTNSLAVGVAVVVTVVGDLLLIPHYHAVGAAVASCAAYLTSTAALFVCYLVVRRSFTRAEPELSAVGAS